MKSNLFDCILHKGPSRIPWTHRSQREQGNDLPSYGVLVQVCRHNSCAIFMKGERGLPGHKGEGGPQGVPGPQVGTQQGILLYMPPLNTLLSQILPLCKSSAYDIPRRVRE